MGVTFGGALPKSTMFEPCNEELPEEFKPKYKPPEIEAFRDKWIYEVLSNEKMIEMLHESEKLEVLFKGDSELSKEVHKIVCEIYNKYKIWR